MWILALSLLWISKRAASAEDPPASCRAIFRFAVFGGSAERGADEFLVIAESIVFEHEGPGHEISEDVDPETDDRLLICDPCEQVLYLSSADVPDLEADEAALVADLPARS